MMSPYYKTLRQAVGKDVLLIPAVAAIIHDFRHRLLLQQKTDGSWSLPAGAIEPGESPEEAVRREVLEETGFQCVSSELVKVLGGPTYRHTYPNADQVEYLIVVFKCVAARQTEIADTRETSRIRLFARAEVPALALPYDMDMLYA
ncbi:MAG: NUDIX domain-containing protein [Planctomycetota bacterium]|nr:NUDIX domain-containing protein [Planctomycetota bacterium]